MKYCTYCGAENDDESLFCSKCGQQMPQLKVDAQTERAPLQEREIVTANTIDAAEQVNTKAKVCGIIGFVLGLWAIVFSWMSFIPGAGLGLGFLPVISSIAGLILVHISNKAGGYKLTRAAKILSIIGVCIGSVCWIIGSIMTISLISNLYYYGTSSPYFEFYRY